MTTQGLANWTDHRKQITDDDQTRDYTVKRRNKLGSMPAIRLTPVSQDYWIEPQSKFHDIERLILSQPCRRQL